MNRFLYDMKYLMKSISSICTKNIQKKELKIIGNNYLQKKSGIVL